MDSWEDLFIGKTVDEVDAFYAKYTADRNGRVLNSEATNEADKKEYDALSDADKKIVVRRALRSDNEHQRQPRPCARSYSGRLEQEEARQIRVNQSSEYGKGRTTQRTKPGSSSSVLRAASIKDSIDNYRR